MTAALQVDDLRVTYRVRRGGLARRADLRAVDGVSFTVARGETLAVVGESGSGKSTIARAIMRLVPATGSVVASGCDVLGARGTGLQQIRRTMQMVFQDPYSSLDPSMRIADTVGEPLEVHFGLRGQRRDDRVADLLTRVGLAPSDIHSYPHEFSGGQRQRIAIARAIAVEPDVLICDEAVSSLDVSTQNQIIALIQRLQTTLEMACVFIAHDLAVVRHLAHRVAVMHLGEFVEVRPTALLFEKPAHPYTRALLDAAPIPDPTSQRRRTRTLLSGEPPDPTDPPSGCRFRTRCPLAFDRCVSEHPELESIDTAGAAACHLVDRQDRVARATRMPQRGSNVVVNDR